MIRIVFLIFISLKSYFQETSGIILSDPSKFQDVQIKSQNYFDQFKKTKPSSKLKLAIVNGTDNIDSNLQHEVDKSINFLKQIEISKNDLLYWVEDGGTHLTKSWSKQTKRILEWMC